MIFRATGLEGAWLIEPERLQDDRGYFARTFCAEEFARHGLDTRCAQCNVSFNHRRGTLRGMHFQRAPHEEAKLVRCTAGAIHDCIVDLRENSATYLHSYAVRLDAANGCMLYVPGGFAHGFQTLEDDTEVFYQMSTPYVAAAAAGFRHDDPLTALAWPLPVSVIAERDLAFAPLTRSRR